MQLTDPHSPRAKVGGVEYGLDYGEGTTLERYGDHVEHGPVYVWYAVEVPDYTAPPHVAAELGETLEEAAEIAALERAAGWDPYP